MADDFKSLWYPNVSAENIPSVGRPVACMPLMTLLKKLGITHIDFLSLDVEGAELEVLRTLDLSKVTIKAIVVEMDGHDTDKDTSVSDLLLGRGFVRVDLRGDRLESMASENGYFIHHSFVSLVSARGTGARR
jgi:hypothetical protein